MSSSNRENVQAILVNFRQTSEKMTDTIVALQQITERINRGEGSIGALVNDDTTVRNLNDTLASLKDISSKINEGQGTLGKLVNEDSTIEKVDDALTGVNEYLTKADAFKIYVDYRGEWMFEHDALKSTVNVRIQPTEDKYYLVGIVSDDIGSHTYEERVITINGVERTETEEGLGAGEHQVQRPDRQALPRLCLPRRPF